MDDHKKLFLMVMLMVSSFVCEGSTDPTWYDAHAILYGNIGGNVTMHKSLYFYQVIFLFIKEISQNTKYLIFFS